MTVKTPDHSIQLNAMLAGAAAFIAVYAAGVVAIVLVSTLLKASPAYDALMLALRVGGWLALAFPAWVAVRVANRNAWSYGALFGALQGLTVVVLMTQSFSWEGTLCAEVMESMLPAFVLVFASAMLGSAFASWQNRRLPHQPPTSVTGQLAAH